MIQRLLNPHIILKITLILTTLLLLPTSSWANVKFQTTGAPFKPDGAPTQGTQKYEWNVNRSSSKWEISFGTSLTLTDTGFKANLYDTSTNRSVSISGFTRPTSGTCKIKKISLSGSNLSNCNITTKIGDSYEFQRSETTGDFSPNGNDTYYQWDNNSSSINITIARNNSDVEITVSSITVEVTDIDDDNTEFRWPASVNEFNFNQESNSLTVNAGLLQQFSYPLELSEYTGVTAASTSRNVTYSSSEQQIATIDDNGKITLRKVGATVITATVNGNDDYRYTNGHKEYSFTLNSQFQGPTLSLGPGLQSFGSPIYMTYPGDYNAVSIKYKWKGESELNYDPENPPTVKAGELTAWGEITNNGTIIKSEEVTATYVASYDITIAGTAVTSNNAGNILSGGVNNEKVRYYQETNTLTLKGAVLTDDIICNTTSLFIDIQGHNTITTNGKPAITTTLETSSPTITIMSSSETKGSLVLKNTSTGTPCGGVFRGPSTSITVKTADPIATLLPTDQGYLTSDTTHIAAFGEYYDLTVGNYKVGNINATDILGDGKAIYNPSSQTLSLNGVTIPRIQCTAEHPLIIEISGTNTVGMMSGSGDENNTLTITKKKGDSSSASLDVDTKGQVLDGMSPICHFSKCTWDDGLYLDAYTYTYNNDVPEKTSIYGVYYGKKGNNYNFISPTGDNIGGLTFSETQPTATPSIWVSGLQPNGNGKFITGNDSIVGVWFNASKNTLTLNAANSLGNGGNIISSLPNLTINMVGGQTDMGGSRIISSNPKATLTFTTEKNNPGYLSNSLGDNNLPWQGFAGDPTFENKLVYLPNHDSQFIKVLEAPSINYSYSNSNGLLEFGGLSDGYGNNSFDCHYTITYAEGDPDQGSVSVLESSVQKSLKPCTITAYVEFTDIFNKTTQSDIATAKYFGLETEELTVPYQASVNAPAVFPALPEGVTVSYRNKTDATPTNPIDANGVININGLGTDLYYASTTGFSDDRCYEGENGEMIFILNEVEPIADIPTCELGQFSLTVEPMDLKDVTIEDISNQTYTGSEIHPKPVVKNGNLVLQEAKTADDGDYTISYSNNIAAALATAENAPTVTITGKGNYTGTATKTFTITAKSLEEAKVTLADDKSEFTYNEAANVPTITQVSLTEETGATLQLTAGTDYTLSYVKVNGETEEAIEADKVINAGSYKMILTGKGNFSGTKAIPFTITPRAITNLTFNLSATSFTYNGEAQKPTVTVQFEETELEASKGTTKTIPTTDYDLTFSGECINAGTYSVSASLKGNYSGSGDGPSFTITKATISPKVTLAGWTYGATANTPSVSGNTGNGEVTYAYKLQNEAESAFAAAVPTNAGAYTVKASIAATANYEAAVDTAHFTIAKDDITPTVTLEGWTYGSTPNKPEVKGNTGNGAETITYKAEGTDVFTSEVPTAVGTHTVKVTIAETANYNGGEATATFTIINSTFNAAKDITFAEGQTYASFYSSSEDLELPESGIAVYMITGIEGNTLITQAVSYIPKATPVLIEKTETAVEVKEPSEIGTNMLKYATENVSTDGTLYILYNGEYVKATGTIPQGKCYLKPTKPSGSRRLTIGHNNGTTGISNFDVETGTDRWYDLNGQRINKPQKKGLYIKNGKKIIVK